MARSKVYNSLIGGSGKGRHPSVMGSELSVNMYSETSNGSVYQASLPGLKYLGKASGRCRGCWVSSVGLAAEGGNPELFAVQGDTLWRYTETGKAQAIGKVAGDSRVVFAETAGLRDQLLIADGTNLWRYDLQEGKGLVPLQLPNRVTGSGEVIRPTHVAVVSGSIVVNDAGSGFVYYSVPYALDSEERELFDVVDGQVQYEDGITVKTVKKDADTVVFLDRYQVQQYFNAESSSDRIMGVCAVGDRLYLFGQSTVEIWQRGSSEYETWVRASYTGNASNGLDSAYSIAVLDSTVYYIAAGSAYGKCIMSINGSSFSRISDEWLEQLLLSEDTTSSYSFSYAQGQHRFIVIQMDNQKQTWCYDVASKQWHQRTSRELATGAETQWRVGAIAYYRNKFYAFCTDGMYIHGDDYWYEDYGSTDRLPMIRHRQTPVWVDNNVPFIVEHISIECNVGCWGDYGKEPQLLLEISGDGGMTYGNIHAKNMGRVGDYGHRIRYAGLGRKRLCVVRLTYSHPTSLELSAMNVVATVTGEVM